MRIILTGTLSPLRGQLVNCGATTKIKLKKKKHNKEGYKIYLMSQNVESVISVVNYDATIRFSLMFLHLRSILNLRMFVKTIADMTSDLWKNLMQNDFLLTFAP